LAASVLLEQFFIAPIFPWLGNLGSLRPMVVFLDIPLELPAIDVLPVSVLFALFYQIAPSAGLTREHPGISSGARVWKALTSWWTLLILLAAGGGAFYLVQGYLPRAVSNGIDSFGVRADVTLPYPSGGLIHLHGSVVMLAFTALGIVILNRRTATPALQPQPADIRTTGTPAAEPLSSSVVSSSGTLISPSINEVFATQQQPRQQPQQPQQPQQAQQTQQPQRPQPAASDHTRYQPSTVIPGYEKPLVAGAMVAEAILNPEPPPTCRLTTPPPIAVVMPRPAPGIGKMHPCYVIGGLKPVKIP
jgi:hypothetical protein